MAPVYGPQSGPIISIRDMRSSAESAVEQRLALAQKNDKPNRKVADGDVVSRRDVLDPAQGASAQLHPAFEDRLHARGRLDPLEVRIPDALFDEGADFR